MISIDKRVGSSHLARYLGTLGCPVEVVSLPYGDACWTGRGPEERPILCGVELKTIDDLVNSLQDGRLAGHQLIGLLDSYEHVYLVIEGLYRCGSDGALETRHGGGWAPLRRGRVVLWREVQGLLTTLETQCGVHVRETSGRLQTAQTIAGLYHWWTAKAYEQHRGHLAFHTPPSGYLFTPSLQTRIAKEFPGVGWERAHAIGRAFGSPLHMALAGEQEYRAIPGVGKVLAKRLVDAWQGVKS